MDVWTARQGRLSLLEPVRQYEVEQLAERPDAEAVRERHLQPYLAVAIARSPARATTSPPACGHARSSRSGSTRSNARFRHDLTALALFRKLGDESGKPVPSSTWP